MRLLARVIVNTVVIVALMYLLPAVELTSWKSALVAAVLLGLLNTFVRPIFRFLSLPINVLTLGLFVLIVNGVILKILDWLMKSLNITGFLWTIITALLISVLTTAVNILIGGDTGRSQRSR